MKDKRIEELDNMVSSMPSEEREFILWSLLSDYKRKVLVSELIKMGENNSRIDKLLLDVSINKYTACIDICEELYKHIKEDKNYVL